MRSTVAYYLLLVYALMLLKPIVPIVADTFSHTFGESIHLSTVHMVYGADHAEKEVSTENNKSKKSGDHSIKADDFSQFHVVVMEQASPSNAMCFDIEFSCHPQPFISSFILAQQGPPPKYS